tara:strand:- start:51 stop:308 length:258 start_codon:yes stop_codon:yes gene_type:complete
MKKNVISKKTIKVGNKHYTEEKYWAMFPSDRIITARTRKLTMEDFFNVGELVLILLAGFFLLKILFGFANGMEALSELDTLLRGY